MRPRAPAPLPARPISRPPGPPGPPGDSICENMHALGCSVLGTHTFYIPTRIMIELRLHAALSWALFIAQAYLLAKKLKHEVDIMGFFGNRTLFPLATIHLPRTSLHHSSPSVHRVRASRAELFGLVSHLGLVSSSRGRFFASSQAGRRIELWCCRQARPQACFRSKCSTGVKSCAETSAVCRGTTIGFQ